MNRIEIIKNHLIFSTPLENYFNIIEINNCNSNNNNNKNILKEMENSKIKIIEYKNGCRRIILNRSEALNSLTIEMLRFLLEKLREFNDDYRCKFVIINSSTEKSFCSGGDIKEFAQFSQSPTGVNPFIKIEYTMDHLIHTFNKPILSFVNGIVMGGGVGLSIHCSHRIVGDNVQWAMPENKIGYFPDVGTSYFLSKLGSIGLYLGMVGVKINSKDLINIKLATHYIPNDLLERTLEELCNDEDIEGFRQIDFILNKYRKTLYADKESSHLVKYQTIINKCFNKKFKSVIEILNQLKDEITNERNHSDEREWASKTLSILLDNSCPTSVCISFETIHRALQMNIDQIFEMEIRVGTRIGNREDISQGVRKTLIDKNYKPIYSPSSIYDISQSFIDSFFLPLNDEKKEFSFSIDE
ncbi:hypothetical protein RB653_007873 [Dictyostelium firmibasis]|uniref:Enoyl-CoA hydratase/isomerase domain-containing protein n=1 Tax=Dictyostelium firmibasis TaxID=79012 RepID=A0AAN7TPC9_9MYCE